MRAWDWSVYRHKKHCCQKTSLRSGFAQPQPPLMGVFATAITVRLDGTLTTKSRESIFGASVRAAAEQAAEERSTDIDRPSPPRPAPDAFRVTKPQATSLSLVETAHWLLSAS